LGAICFNALIDAYEITKNEKYLSTALSSVNFVLKDLTRTPHNSGFLFSYSPLNGNNTVYNASLLGAMLLSRSYLYSKNEEQIDLEYTIKQIEDSHILRIRNYRIMILKIKEEKKDTVCFILYRLWANLNPSTNLTNDLYVYLLNKYRMINRIKKRIAL
jgi:hypothetical protein